ncbi:MAG: hypothetical protein CTY12_00850 [Methylotenera sp.]|nr:MAG: hypothetical protein CTY12_00850 [Methylotenera sp.]
MKVVALVGRIGSGKSTVRQMFDSDSRIITLDLDKYCNHMRLNNPAYKQALVDTFGPDSLDPNKSISLFLDKVFLDQTEYRRLIDVIEPFLYSYMLSQFDLSVQDGSSDMIVFEGAALIHSKQLLDICDEIVAVRAPESVCRNRVIRRNESRYTNSQLDVLLMRTNIDVCVRDITHIIDSHVPITHMKRSVEHIIQRIRHNDGFKQDPTHKIAIYQGSFNPLHLGHLDVINDALRTFDEVVLLRCRNAMKTQDDRFEINKSMLPIGCTLIEWDKSFVSFLDQLDNLKNVTVIRGIRNGVDLQYENDYVTHITAMFFATFHKTLPPVLYVPCRQEHQHISSSGIKAILPFDELYARGLMVI